MKLFALRRPHRLTEAFNCRNLALYLIEPPTRKSGLAGGQQSFLTLDEALQSGHARLHETGRVGELEIENLTGADLFAQAGDVVKGGWQDRALGMDFIVPQRATRPRRMRVRTFCVERGRWRQRADEPVNTFRSAEHTAASRELKLSIRHARSQSAVWSSVDAAQEKLSRSLGADVRPALSPSSLPLTVENELVRQRVTEYLHALGGLPALWPQASGFAFAINGRLNSADLYASPKLFRKMWPKLLEAAALEALAEAEAPGVTWSKPTPEEVSLWLTRARGGRKTKHAVTSRVTLVVRENEGQVSFETIDSEQGDLCVHQNILAAK